MTLPGFKAEASLYKMSESYRGAGGPVPSGGAVRPAISSCRQICQGDPDCLQCCLCIRRGGHPRQCCF